MMERMPLNKVKRRERGLTVPEKTILLAHTAKEIFLASANRENTKLRIFNT